MIKKSFKKKRFQIPLLPELKNLSAVHKSEWGEMTASEMLLHCNSCNRQILEESRGDKKNNNKNNIY